MNKNNHLLIFNPTRGCTMAVAETASSATKTPSATSKAHLRPSKWSKSAKSYGFTPSEVPTAQWIRAQAAPVLMVFESYSDNQINLLAAKNESSQTSTNSSSSSSIGASFSAKGISANASVSRGSGKSDGQDTTFTNTNVSAGNTATITSGGDTNVIGAVVEANRIKADIGGSLKVESLQDTSTFTSSQKSANASISVPITGGSFGGSVGASKSNVDSNFQSVGQQSGLKAGDGGFQVDVAKNTALVGAVIASNQAALENARNSFRTGGALSITDIQNTASFKGEAVGASVGVGTQPAGSMGLSGVGVGIGSAGGNAASTTTAGISGIAGNTAVRTGDAETGLQRIFDADKVQREINAQVAITQAFTREAPKAVATFSDNQAKELRNAGKEEEAKKWDEGGTLRVVLHTLMGAFGGGASGAAGAAVSASAAPLMNQLQDGIASSLQTAGLSADAAKGIAQGIAGLTAAGVGAAVGGAQGAASAATVDFNNRQLHPTEIKWIADNRKAFADKLSKELGRTVTEQEAMYWLTAAGESNVDAGMQRSNAQFVRGTSNTEDARAYDNAKAFIAGGTKANSSFTDERGQAQNLFSTTNSEFYKPEVYSQWKNDANYRDYYWNVMGINLKGDKLSSAEQAIYDQRQAIVNDQTVKQLALFGVQALAGKVASNVAGKAEQYAGAATKTSAQEFTPAPGKSVVTPKADGEFQTLGLNNVDPMRLPDGVKMVRELERGGLSPDKAIERAKEFISSGATPPVATPLDITDKLVKVVPTGGQPSLGTGYWMRESELSILQKDPASMANRLGLPPGMQVDSFVVV
jgi:filamentous hemagglutinin